MRRGTFLPPFALVICFVTLRRAYGPRNAARSAEDRVRTHSRSRAHQTDQEKDEHSGFHAGEQHGFQQSFCESGYLNRNHAASCRFTRRS